MTNYKKLYGITMKEAKELAKSKLGCLPRPGREVIVESGTKMFTINHLDGKKYTSAHDYQIYLSNSAGSFYLWRYISVN